MAAKHKPNPLSTVVLTLKKEGLEQAFFLTFWKKLSPKKLGFLKKLEQNFAQKLDASEGFT